MYCHSFVIWLQSSGECLAGWDSCEIGTGDGDCSSLVAEIELWITINDDASSFIKIQSQEGIRDPFKFYQQVNLTSSSLNPLVGPLNTQNMRIEIQGQYINQLYRVLIAKKSVDTTAYQRRYDQLEEFFAPSLNTSATLGEGGGELYFGMLCRFASAERSLIAQATYEAARKSILCEPFLETKGYIDVSVSLNGYDFSNSVPFYAYPQPILSSSRPAGIMIDQKTRLNLTGIGFPDEIKVIAADLMKCKLSVAGSAEDVRDIGTVIWPGEFVNRTMFRCLDTPTYNTVLRNSTPAQLSVTFNDQDYTETLRFMVIRKQEIRRIVPIAGPNAGGTNLTLEGINFEAPLDNSDGNNVLCRFGRTDNDPKTAATLLSDTQIKCASKLEGEGNRRVDVQVERLELAFLGVLLE